MFSVPYQLLISVLFRQQMLNKLFPLLLNSFPSFPPHNQFADPQVTNPMPQQMAQTSWLLWGDKGHLLETEAKFNGKAWNAPHGQEGVFLAGCAGRALFPVSMLQLLTVILFFFFPVCRARHVCPAKITWASQREGYQERERKIEANKIESPQNKERKMPFQYRKQGECTGGEMHCNLLQGKGSHKRKLLCTARIIIYLLGHLLSFISQRPAVMDMWIPYVWCP